MNAETARSHALEAWASLRSACFREDANGITLLEGPDARRAPVWPFSQSLAAAVDLAVLTGDTAEAERFVVSLSPYACGHGYAPMPRRRRRYYDDNAWIGLALMQLYLQTDHDRHLAHARRIFWFVAEGQDRDGGVRWMEGRRSRNTCATAPATQLALRLHPIEKEEALTTFATKTLSWLHTKMRLDSGLFGDHVDRWGRLDRTVWSYNQGSVVGAFTLAHRLDDAGGALDDIALDDAMKTALHSLKYFDAERTWRHPPVFNAVWFRNLLALDAVERVPGLDEALDAYLDRAWRDGRDDDGLFTAGGIGTYDGTPAIDASGLVQLFALRAWPRDQLPVVS